MRREYANPQGFALPATGNATDDVVRNAATKADRAVFSRPDDSGGWYDVTSAEFLADVVGVAKGLIAAGVQVGDRVALLSKTRYEWTLCDYAIWFAGAITVPIYETSSADQIRWILEDSGTSRVMVETKEHAERVESVREGLGLRNTWVIDNGDLVGLEQAGALVTDEDLEAQRTTPGPDSIATVIYTSGTTGRPKGCELTHSNFMYEVEAATQELSDLFSDDASTLLFLPLAHVFARVIQAGCIHSATKMGHAPDIKHLVDDLGSFKPTFLLAVPRVFEKVFNSAAQNAAASGRDKIFNKAVDIAVAFSRAEETGKVPLALRAQHKVFDGIVYNKLRAALGGHCSYAISGGAPLGDRLGHFFHGVGLTVLEGYGLTETTAALTVNTPGHSKIGTVGRPLPGTSVKVADDGELLFRGGQVLRGYWHNDAATAEAITEDWFHTGDLGQIDDDGFVSITGRKKEIIVTAGGKNVAPAQLEDRIRGHVLIDQVMVVGEAKPYIAALVTLDLESLPAWAAARHKAFDLATLVDDPEVRKQVQDAIDDANKTVSHAEGIKKFMIVPAQWTEEGGQLTPSLKLKRNVVMAEHADDIAKLYA